MGIYRDVLKKHYSNAGIIINGYLRGRILLFDFKKILQFIPSKTKKIVDVGCGYGFLDFMFVHRFKKTKVLASDLNSKRISYLKGINKNKNLSFECVDATNSKMDADLIICVDLLHHMDYKQQDKLLEKMYRNSPDDVKIIIKDMDNPKYSISYIVSYFIDIISAKQYPIYFRSKSQFIEFFSKKGFTVEKVAYVNRWFIPLNHVLFVMTKTKSNKTNKKSKDKIKNKL